MENSNHTFAVCAYKESPHLEACIRSLKNQSFTGNILLATSTSNSFIENIAKKYKIPYYVRDGKSGITQDWNFAYQCAKENYNSDFITIAHQDDIYEKDYVETLQKMMGREKRPLIFFSDYYEIRDGKRIEKNQILKVKRLMLFPLRFRIFQRSRWVRRRILSFGSPICCPSVAFAAENMPPVIFQNHFRACEDWEAWEKLSRYKGAFVYSSKKLVGHRIHADSETSAAIEDQVRSKEELEMFCKFWPRGIAKFLGEKYAKSQESNQL